MKLLVIILLFLAAGVQAQINKHEYGKGRKPEKKAYLKTDKKNKMIGAKNFKDDQMKRIINLSQEKEGPRKEMVKKSNNDDRGAVIYEETSSVRYRMYLFIG